MELNNNDAAVGTDSTNAQATTTSAGEIDLYAEVIAFAALSSEERLRLLDRPVKVSVETGRPSADADKENASLEPVLTHTPIQPVEAATAASEKRTPSPEAEEHTSPEPVLTHSTIEPVQSDTTVPAAESARDSDVSKAYVEAGEVRPPLLDATRPSGPLSGFNLPPEIVYTGALTRGVCLACGAESSADDLFCMACGGFIDEIATTFPFNPTCGECKQRIAADEIFCPWCGSGLPVV